MSTLRRRDAKSEGNTLILSLMVMTMLIALASAQFAVVQKNVQSSSFFLAYSDLHKYAESGVAMALHDLNYGVTGNGGKIGTLDWTTQNDVGKDGIAGTLDLGEGDGIPTVGEPNVHPAAAGTTLDTQLIVYVDSTSLPGIIRVVSNATSSQGSATVDTLIRRTIATLPKVAAVFIDPDAVLDLKGNAFLIDGNDHNPDGTAGPGPAVAGIATLPGIPAGANAATFLSQISSKNYDQIVGEGPSPSLMEKPGVQFDLVYNTFKNLATNKMAPGTYTSPTLGSWTDSAPLVSYANGDLHFSGKGSGAGVLVVDGSITITGQFTFYGMVIVKGDIRLSGGGAGVHTFGTVMVGQTITAIDPESSEVVVSGNADLFYSSAVLSRLENMLQARYSLVYYDEK